MLKAFRNSGVVEHLMFLVSRGSLCNIHGGCGGGWGVTVSGSAHNLQGFPAGVCSVGVGYNSQGDPSLVDCLQCYLELTSFLILLFCSFLNSELKVKVSLSTA